MCIVEIDSLNFVMPIKYHIKYRHAILIDKEKIQGLDLSKVVIILDINKHVDKQKQRIYQTRNLFFLKKNTS